MSNRRKSMQKSLASDDRKSNQSGSIPRGRERADSLKAKAQVTFKDDKEKSKKAKEEDHNHEQLNDVMDEKQLNHLKNNTRDIR